MTEQRTFQQWIKQRRKDFDLTQKDLAESVGCSITTIRKFEANARRPSKQMAELLAHALAIPSRERARFYAAARGIRPWQPPNDRALTNIGLELSPFIGRKQETEQILARLNDDGCRLLTLVGPGGIGKTRLAAHAARIALPLFSDGVYVVPLASLDDEGHIVAAIAEAIGFKFLEQGNHQAQLLDYLMDKHLLLLMDNYEHLLKGAELLTQMLTHCGDLKIMVTSWEQLHSREEWIVQVGGLSYPVQDTPVQDIDSLIDCFDAVRLFVQAATRTQPTFSLQDNVQPVIRICQLVSGIPLGIEIAAGWLSTIDCDEIAAFITQDFDFLQTGTRNVPTRHQSLRAIFQRSWMLLPDTERAAFIKLSIFRTGFTLEAAQYVADASPLSLKRLVEKSLIQLRSDGRYTIHEYLRQYAFKELEMSGLLPEIKALFVRYYVSMARQAEEPLKTAERMKWVNRLNAELDHLRLLRQWCNSGDVSSDDEMTLLGDLWIYWSWYFRNLNELAEWGDEALRRVGSIRNARSLMGCWAIGSTSTLQGRHAYGLPIVTEAVAVARERGDRCSLGFLLAGVGIAQNILGDTESSLEALEESVALVREMSQDWFLPIALAGLANTLLVVGDLDRASREFTEALQIAEQYGHVWEIGLVLYFASHCAFLEGDFGRAQQQIQRAISIHTNTDHLWSLANLLNVQGHLHRLEGDLDSAEAAFEQCIDIYRYLGNRRNVANVLISLGKLAHAKNEYQMSNNLLVDAIQLAYSVEHSAGVRNGLAALGELYLEQGYIEQAAILLGASEKLCVDLYDTLHAHLLFETAYDYSIARNAVMQAGYIESWARGVELTSESLLAYILEHITEMRWI
jgi:predicted ATPase/DNA-binding XRE family transcriptional regulator